jgi:glycosyltransferase involved in cell wall biosynthesis
MLEPKQKIMVTLSAGNWDGVQHRPHHFMKRAASNGRTIIYIEPPVSLIAPLKNRQLLKSWKRWRAGMQMKKENLYVLTPPPILPFGYKYRIVNKINQWILSKQIRKATDHLNSELELYSFLPSSVDLLNKVNFQTVYYDCVDDHASFSGFIKPKLVHQLEKELVELADVCFATAQKLFDDRLDWNTNFHLIPNGAEFEHFSKVQAEKMLIPWDIEEAEKPVIGFIGGISDWIDLKLIEDTAHELPSYSFVMIGPIDTNISSLKSLKNVYFLGPKPYENLPNYIQSFDVCLIPFKINELTKSVNPIKMYEYLSAGKPVISTPLPEVLQYKDVVEIAETKEEMVREILKATKKREPEIEYEKVKIRQKIGRENSWDARWEMVSALLK